MPTIAEKRQVSKRGMAEQGRRREAFGWIAAVSLMWKEGWLDSRERAMELIFLHATAEDLKLYRLRSGEALPIP